MTIRILFTLLLACGILFNCSNKEFGKPLDYILTNGKIWTGDPSNPWATWVAIRGNRIESVGDETTKVPDAAKIIDLEGKLTLPGFNDSHVHFASAGHLLLGINLLDVNVDDLFVQRVEETVGRLPEGSWITGGSWGAYEAWNLGSEGGDTKSQEWVPSRSLIDDITPNHPVLVLRYDRKMGLANAVALDYFGIDSETGVLAGPVLTDYLESIPEKSFDRKIAEGRRALEECRKWGVTTVQDMSPPDQLDVYQELRQ